MRLKIVYLANQAIPTLLNVDAAATMEVGGVVVAGVVVGMPPQVVGGVVVLCCSTPRSS